MKKKKRRLFEALLVLFTAGFVLLGVLILYPVWRLFAWMSNSIGVKGIRNIDGRLETPVVFYENSTTQRIVVFIATIHLAEPKYYSALQQLIESLFGYKILFEGVGKLSPDEKQTLNKKERNVAKNFDYVFDFTLKLGSVMGLQNQRKGLAYSTSWVNADMRLYDLIRSFAQRDAILTKKEIKHGDFFDDEAVRLFIIWFVNRLLSRFVPVAIILDALTFFSRKERIAKKLILDARNEVAIEGIKKYLGESNIITIWGAAHLRGIERQLKRVGFREVRCEWFTAYHVRDYNLRGCIKEIISIAKRTR